MQKKRLQKELPNFMRLERVYQLFYLSDRHFLLFSGLFKPCGAGWLEEELTTKRYGTQFRT